MKCASCGHDREFHDHYRPETDCSICWCPKFAAPAWRLLVDWIARWWRRG